MNRSRLQIASETLKAFDQSKVRHGQDMACKNEQKRVSLGIPAIDEKIEGGLAASALHEVRCSYARDVGAAAGFVLSLISTLKKNDERRIIWIIDPAAAIECGSLFPAGLAQFGIDPARLFFVKACNLQKAMWAADEAAGCNDLAAMVIQIKGNPLKFDMTATRRLMLRSKQSGVLSLILRQSGEEEATVADTRWHVGVEPSLKDENYHRGLGRMRHALTLERNRNGQLGKWPVTWNHKERVFEYAAQTSPSKITTTNSIHCLYPSANRPHSADEMGQVVAIGQAS